MNEQIVYTTIPFGDGTINHMDSSEQQGNNTAVVERQRQPAETKATRDVANVLEINETKNGHASPDYIPHQKIVEDLKKTDSKSPEDKGIQDLMKELKGLDTDKPLNRNKLFELIKAIFAVKKIMVEYKKNIQNQSDLQERLTLARKTIRKIADVLKKHGFNEHLVDSLVGNLEKMAEETEGFTPSNQEPGEEFTTEEEIAVEPLLRDAPMYKKVYKAFVRGRLAENDGDDPESYPGSLQNKSDWSDDQLREAYKQIGERIDITAGDVKTGNRDRKDQFNMLDYIENELERRGVNTREIDELREKNFPKTPDEMAGMGAAGGQQTPPTDINIDTSGITDPQLAGIKEKIDILKSRLQKEKLSIGDIDKTIDDALDRMPTATTTQLPVLREIVQRLEEARNSLLDSTPTPEERLPYEEQQFRQMVGASIDEEDYPYFFLDSTVRDKVLNDILASADSQPAEGWRDVMNSFTPPGRRLEQFRKFVSNALVGKLDKATQREVPNFPKFIEKWKDKTTNKKITDERLIAGFNDIKRDYPRILEEIEVRGIIHDLNGVMYRPSLKLEDIAKFAQALDSGYGDIAFRIEGVKEMKNIIEMVMRQVMAENNGYLPPAAMTGSTQTQTVPEIRSDGTPEPEDPNDPNSKPKMKGLITTLTKGRVEDLARERFKEIYKKGQVFRWNEDTGKPFPAAARELQDWEVGRIFVLARGLMIADGRMLTLASESKIPPGGTFTSLFLQDILQGVAGFVHLLAKYQITEDHLAALLHPGAFVKKNDLVDAWHAYAHDSARFIAGLPHSDNPFVKKFAGHFYINQLNPTRAGDIYSYAGWRFNPERGNKEGDETISAVRRFMEMGREHMLQRYLTDPNNKFGLTEKDVQDIAKNDKRQPIGDYLRYKQALYPNLHSAEELARQPITKSDVIIVNAYLTIPQGMRPPFKEFMEKANIEEYANWIGNSMRLERLRGKLETKDKKAIGDGKTILAQIVRMQPHRLYTISGKLQTKMEVGNVKYNANYKETQDILQNLSIVEQMFWQSREEFLDDKNLDFKDRTFSKIDFIAKMKDPNDWFAQKLRAVVKDKDGNPSKDTNPDGSEKIRHVFTKEEVDAMYEFAMKVRRIYGFDGQYAMTADEQTPGNIVGRREMLYDEFIKSRNYNHGFGLWASEDPTILHLADTGPSAGFARRYRDMEASAKAYGETITLLASLGHYQAPEQIMEQLDKVYQAVGNFDTSKAKQMVSELIPGIAMFYSKSGFESIPLLGNLWNILPGRQGKKHFAGTFAEYAYGARTMKWDPVARNYFIKSIRERNWLTADQMKECMKIMKGSNREAIVYGAAYMGQLAALAFMLYLISEGMKEK